MHASLALRDGVLYVLRYERTAHVGLYDLDGRELEGGFSWRDQERSQTAATGIAVDRDRRLWVADPGAGAVRGFTVFGSEKLRLGPSEEQRATLSPAELDEDRAGVLSRPTCVACQGSSDDLRLLVGSSGRRRHGLHLFAPDGTLIRSLRPMGQSHGRFAGIEGVFLDDRHALACEPRAGRVQVFRDLDFHFAFQLPDHRGAGLEPRAAVRLADGRLVVAHGGPRSGVLLMAPDGGVEAQIAGHGAGSGQVLNPSDVVVEPGPSEPRSRVVVADQDGERIQVLTLDGRCYGSLEPPN
ncbi:hypothetical protein [Engelhardtia mirabilis]|uniref:NHL repeat protein n=1 Tax=Engelhardtia mirabilis TaxID=2528011 RepID=A0A518BL93_9BACT|nr:hypothetical protein Pla133_28260 [Planctomycetes bacterium Pla133]QDV02063.1 hypothetical protein Pla86_28250 [Planctomycetes bacterium Pla86]